MCSLTARHPVIALGIGLAVLLGHPLAASAGADDGGDVVLEICRLPGTEAAYSDQIISVPAGTEFLSDPFGRDLLPAVAGVLAPTPDPTLAVITVAPVSVPTDGSCAYAKVRPVGALDAAALNAGFGRMFVVNHGPPSRALTGQDDTIYGLLLASQD